MALFILWSELGTVYHSQDMFSPFLLNNGHFICVWYRGMSRYRLHIGVSWLDQLKIYLDSTCNTCGEGDSEESHGIFCLQWKTVGISLSLLHRHNDEFLHSSWICVCRIVEIYTQCTQMEKPSIHSVLLLRNYDLSYWFI